jgi:hypothetical protein
MATNYEHATLLFGEDVIINSDRDTIIDWVKSMLGDDPSSVRDAGVTVELGVGHYDAAIDDSLQEYSAIINEWSALDNLANTFDSPGGTNTGNPDDIINISQRRVLSTFGFLLQKTNKYSELVQAGGNVTESEAYFYSTVNQQDYDLLARTHDSETVETLITFAAISTFGEIVTTKAPTLTDAEYALWDIKVEMGRTINGETKYVDVTDHVTSWTQPAPGFLTITMDANHSSLLTDYVRFDPDPDSGYLIGGSDKFWVRTTIKAPYTTPLYDQDGTAFTVYTLDRKKMEITELKWYEPATIFKYFDPYNMGAQIGAEAFGFGYTIESPIYMMPVFFDILRGAQHEISARVRKQNFSFKENNKRITIWPVPGSEITQVGTGQIWFDYVIPFNPYEDLADEGSIANMSNIPYFQLEYTFINSIGQRWVHKFALATSKEILGRIRGKYTTVPVPDAEISLDAPSLIDEARSEKEELRESLRAILEKALDSALIENEANEAQGLNTVLQFTPHLEPIIMG